MKGRVIALDRLDADRLAVALLVDGRLEDILLDAPKGVTRPNSGAIHLVKITRKLAKSGAFCVMANGSEGFIRDARHLKEGERVLAQVVGLPEPGKAATLTTRLLIKGPHLILTPGAPGVNVSRKIGNTAERARLEHVVASALQEHDVQSPPETAPGVIVRTSARDADERQLAHELTDLVATHVRLGVLRDGTVEATSTVVGDPLSYALREWVDPPPDAILCPPDLASTLQAEATDDGVKRFTAGPGRLARLIPEAKPFDVAGVHDAISALARLDVPLGPGTMVIEPTRALVAVDVNTGTDFSPAAGLKTNLAAARELPRQLRLRGLGGQVAIDFAPIAKKDRRLLTEALAKAFRSDPIETSLVGWTAMGLFELQRKRERWPTDLETL